MADLKISQLNPYLNSEVHNSDVMAIVDLVTGETKKISITELSKRWSGTPAGGLDNQVLSILSGNPYWKNLSKNDVGLNNVNNTSDLNKPISNAVADALSYKANLTDLANKVNRSEYEAGLLTKQDKLPIGTDGNVLTLEGGIPVWRPGGSGGSTVSINHTIQEIADGGKITITSSGNQMVKVKGAGGIATLNLSPFNIIPQDGSVIEILCMDSNDYIIIQESDTDYGVILSDTFYGTRFANLVLLYDNNLKRYFERSRVNRV